MTVHINQNGKRSTFIHIPKNAGTSISRWLWKYLPKYSSDKSREGQLKFGGKHGTESEIQDYFKDLGFIFVCVRNPWDRLLSAYHYYRKQNPAFIGNLSFEQFVMSKDWGRVTIQQIDYYDNLNCLLRYESLEKDFYKIQDYYQIYYPLANENQSHNKNIKDYRPHYTQKMTDRVYERHADDIKRFKYSFE